MPISIPRAAQVPSFLGGFYYPLTLKTDWRDACASHVTPSFLTDDSIELQSNFNLQVSLV